MQLTSLMPGSRRGTYRAVCLTDALRTGDEFWCLVDRNGDPAEPEARSKPEFEVKLLAAGLDLTGRELDDWTNSELPPGLRTIADVGMFEVAPA